MAENTISAALLGCTGLLGSQILSALLAHPSHPIVHAITRRTLSTPSSATLKPVVNPDTSTWAQSLTSINPIPSIFISALGTSRAQAGSLAAQRTIDYDLNLSLARAAKGRGVRVYVIISSGAASRSSPLPYLKLKGEIEEEVKTLGFPYTVIVKPGLLMGRREDSRPAEAFIQGAARGMGMISKGWLVDWWAQDVDLIGRAVVVAGMECLQGKRERGVWELGQSEIVKLGKMQ